MSIRVASSFSYIDTSTAPSVKYYYETSSFSVPVVMMNYNSSFINSSINGRVTASVYGPGGLGGIITTSVPSSTIYIGIKSLSVLKTTYISNSNGLHMVKLKMEYYKSGLYTESPIAINIDFFPTDTQSAQIGPTFTTSILVYQSSVDDLVKTKMMSHKIEKGTTHGTTHVIKYDGVVKAGVDIANDSKITEVKR